MYMRSSSTDCTSSNKYTWRDFYNNFLIHDTIAFSHGILYGVGSAFTMTIRYKLTGSLLISTFCSCENVRSVFRWSLFLTLSVYSLVVVVE